MPVSAADGSGRFRRLLAPLVLAIAVATVWVGPGLVWRQATASVREPAPQQADSLQPPVEPPAPAAARPERPPSPRPVPPVTRLTGLLGIALIIGLGVALSSNRRRISWRVVAWGLGLQVAFAVFVLRVPAGQALFRWLGNVVGAVLHYSYAGSEFVFGELGKPNSSLGVVFAFQILPAIIYVSAHQDHRFTDIVEELRVLVFFAGARR